MTPPVVNKKEFEMAVKAIENEEGWMVGKDAILDPNGAIALMKGKDDHASSEDGYGMVEWMVVSAAVTLLVLLFFSIVAPIFIATFQAQILGALP